MTKPALGCQTARSRTLEVNGLRLHALESGLPGHSPVCLLHGGAAHAHWFDAVTPALGARHHVLVLDQRGHGESAWASPPAYATEDFVADLAGILDHLGWDRVTLVGHSMGGHNAMAFAAWHPHRVRALVIVDARPSIPAERLDRMHARGRRPPRRYPTREAAGETFRLLPPDTVADPALLAHLGRASVVARDGGFASRFDPAAYGARRPADVWPLLGGITGPTLIVRGELSPILPRAMADRMRETIPDAALVEIPGAYHHLMLDRPAAFTAALDVFLRRIGGAGG
jgi:pimeloyl-ACP methyl ester carboxylesterase